MSLVVLTIRATSRLPETGCCCSSIRWIIPRIERVIQRRSYFQYGKKKLTKQRPVIPLTVHSATQLLKAAKSAIPHGTVDLYGSYDVHISLNLDPLETPGHALRGVCSLPHGTGGTCRVVAMTSSKELAEQALRMGALYAGGDVLYKQILVGAVDLRKVDRLIVSEEMAGFCLEPASEMRELFNATSLRFLLPRKSLKTRVASPEEFLESVANYASCKYVTYRTSMLGDVSVTLGKVRTHTAEMIEENLKAVLQHLIETRPANFGIGRNQHCHPRNRGRYILGIRMSRSFRSRSYPLQMDTLLRDVDPNTPYGIGPRIIPPVDPYVADFEETDEYYLNEYTKSSYNKNPLPKQSTSMQSIDHSDENTKVLYVDDDDDDNIEEDVDVERHLDYPEEHVTQDKASPTTALYADEDDDEEVEDGDLKEHSPLYDDKNHSDGDDFNERSASSATLVEVKSKMRSLSDSDFSDEQLTDRNHKDGMSIDSSVVHRGQIDNDVPQERRSVGPLNIDQQKVRQDGRYSWKSEEGGSKGALHAVTGNAGDEFTIKYTREAILKREFELMSKESLLRLQSLFLNNATVKTRASNYSAEPCFGAAAGSLAFGRSVYAGNVAQVPDKLRDRADGLTANDMLAASAPILDLSQVMDMMVKSDVMASKEESLRKGDKIIQKIATLSVKQQQPAVKKQRNAQVSATMEVPALYDDSDDDSGEPLKVLA